MSEAARRPRGAGPLPRGRRDMSFEVLESNKALIPGCTTRVIEGAGVHLCLEKPAEFAGAVLDFMGEPGAWRRRPPC